MTTFQRKQYEKLAEFWKDQLILVDGDAQARVPIYRAYVQFCMMLQKDNPNFKESVFDQASGYTS